MDSRTLDPRDAKIAELNEANARLLARVEELAKQLSVREGLAKKEREGRAKLPYAKVPIRAGALGNFAPGDPLPEEVCKDGLVEGEHYVRGVVTAQA